MDPSRALEGATLFGNQSIGMARNNWNEEKCPQSINPLAFAETPDPRAGSEPEEQWCDVQDDHF